MMHQLIRKEKNMTQLLFIHGLGDRTEDWQKLKFFEGLDYHIHYLDLREMDVEHNQTIDSFVKGITAYVQNLDEQVSLCGFSLGAIIALKVASDMPEKIQSLILIGGQHTPPKFIMNIQKQIFKLLPQRVFSNMIFTKSELIRIIESVKNTTLFDQLSKVTCTTLIICGGKDYFNLRAAHEMAKKIQNANEMIIPGAGHIIYQKNPEELKKVLQKFLKAVI